MSDVDRTATHSPSANKGCIVCKHDDRYESTDQYRAAINADQSVQKQCIAFRAKEIKKTPVIGSDSRKYELIF